MRKLQKNQRISQFTIPIIQTFGFLLALESVFLKPLMKKIDDNLLCNNSNYIGRGNQLS